MKLKLIKLIKHSYECKIFHYRFFIFHYFITFRIKLSLQSNIIDGCYDLLQKAMNFKENVILIVKRK